MTKADQARELFQQGMNKADIARRLGMHYSHVHASVKSVQKDDEITPKAFVMNKQSVRELEQYIQKRKLSRIRKWFASQSPTVDLYETFSDFDCCQFKLVGDEVVLVFKNAMLYDTLWHIIDNHEVSDIDNVITNTDLTVKHRNDLLFGVQYKLQVA